jgi:cobalt/nickel transport system ATP-binding protein
LSNPTETVFELNHAEYSYPGRAPSLCGIDVAFRAGERICILGANGSGKSTLLKLFAGLLFPQKGRFTAFGAAVTEKRMNDDRFALSYHRRVGFIFQDSDVQLFCSTVEEEIAFGLQQQALPPQAVTERTRDMMRMLGIEPLAQRTPFQLSGGEKKKVALASVLVMNPEVLILDEPTNGLDPRTQVWLLRLLQSLSGAGRTLITSTHHLELAARVADRAVLLGEDHAVAADGPVNDLMKNTELLKAVNLVDDSYPDTIDFS